MNVQQETNTAILKKSFDIWNETKGRSVDHWLQVMGTDVKFRSLADGCEGLEFTTLRNGSGEIRSYFDGLLSRFTMIHYTVEHYTAQDDRVIAVGSTSWRHKETGKVFDTPKVDVVRFHDGKIVEFFEVYDTAMVAAATLTRTKRAIPSHLSRKTRSPLPGSGHFAVGNRNLAKLDHRR